MKVRNTYILQLQFNSENIRWLIIIGDIIEAFKTFFFLYTGSDNDITHVNSQED